MDIDQDQDNLRTWTSSGLRCTTWQCRDRKRKASNCPSL